MKVLNDYKSIIISRGVALLGLAILVCGGAVSIRGQQLFDSPEVALLALQSAVKAHDQGALATIFGPHLKDLISGDSVADKNAYDEFAARLGKSIKYDKANGDKLTIVIGEDDWPFAAPIVKTGDKWKFDTEAGVEELISRRIGENEIDAIFICQGYALSQFEYFNGYDWDGDQVSEYAQKIASTPGMKDGLYWEKVEGDEDESPLGPLFAYAAAEGYKTKSNTTQSAAPFHGYYFKILFGQGAAAPGGKFSYLINGNMIAGFALVAYPATYGSSGIMTFVVNQEGRVYEKNLGPQTSAIAGAMNVYNPDVTWKLVDLD
ncbi:MAG TPA: DUF2950 domain-containing protein [Pyrinomonadaceae bacterium]|nr:DUF2950 domain-containing protein [Pyrinomonadaceae bacterium]